MRSEFITDVEQQYEVYCKIAEEYGFIDLNAKKNGFRCTTKSNEFNAGRIAFTGAIAAMREDQQAKIDELQKRVDEQTRHIEMALLAVKDIHKSAIDEFHDWDVLNEKAPKLCEHLQNLSVAVGELEQALKGGSDE